MKPALLAQRLMPLLDSLRCPRCAEKFHLDGASLLCTDGHCFDLSRRGYVNLAPSHDQSAEKYDSTLFESRRLVFQSGFYQPVMDAVSSMLPEDKPFFLLDVGCGEGYYARELATRFPDASILGLDISRDAITAAARIPSRADWLVADLKRLPLADSCADILLDVLTPADYGEFRRVLKQDGMLIKVIPGADYLCEVRNAVAPWLKNGAEYDNARVMEHLSANVRIVTETEIHVTTPISPELSRAFLHMTPMTFFVPDEALDTLTLDQITIHMHIVMCSMA